MTKLALSYDDAARIATTTRTAAGLPQYVSAQTYDANGNPTKLTATTAGTSNSTTTTITSTDKVCR